MLYVYGVLAWLAFLPLPIANGIFREAVLISRFGSYWAHIISTLMLSAALIAGIAIFLEIAAENEDTSALLALGALWVAMTVAFEFGFGRLMAKKSWSILLHDYNLAAGRLWSLVLAIELLTPPLLG